MTGPDQLATELRAAAERKLTGFDPAFGASESAVASPSATVTLPKAYVASWAVLALASTAYLGLTVSGHLSAADSQKNAPRIEVAETAPEPAPRVSVTEPRPAATPQKLTQRLAEKREALADVVAELSQPPVASKAPQADVAPAPRPVIVQSKSNVNQSVLANRNVSTLNFASSAPKGMTVLNAPSLNVPPKPKAAPPIAIAAVSPVVADTTRDTEKPDTAAIETGSLGNLPPLPLRAPEAPAWAKKLGVRAIAAKPAAATPKPIAFGPATVSRPTVNVPTTTTAAPALQAPAPYASEEPAMGIRLASGPSVDALRLQWTLIRERHGAQLSGLVPRYVQTASNGVGPTYELLAGPVPGTIEALEICQGLTRKGGQQCIIGDYVGNRL